MILPGYPKKTYFDCRIYEIGWQPDCSLCEPSSRSSCCWSWHPSVALGPSHWWSPERQCCSFCSLWERGLAAGHSDRKPWEAREKPKQFENFLRSPGWQCLVWNSSCCWKCCLWESLLSSSTPAQSSTWMFETKVLVVMISGEFLALW